MTPVAQRINFMDSLSVKNMAFTSQILTPIDSDKYDDIFRNRLTHAIEVGEFCRLIAINFGLKKERVEEIVNIGLAHDLGHPPLGHKGADLMDEIFKREGLEDGFKDNSNNFSILLNNDIYFSEYTMLGLIKYPDEIYSEHKYLLKDLKKVCKEEAIEQNANPTKTTIGSKIMDLADTISYGGSDVVDGFTTGYTVPYFEDFIQKCILLSANTELEDCFKEISKNIKSKRTVRTQMAMVKMIMVNDVILSDNIVQFKTKTYNYVLDEMNRFSFKYFIRHPKVLRSRTLQKKKFKYVIETLINYPDELPSTLYRKKYNQSRSKNGRLRAIRDCIGDMSDKYVMKLYNEFKRKGL